MKLKGLFVGLIVLSLLILSLGVSAAAQKFAVIVSLRSGTQELMDNNAQLCKDLRSLLPARGFTENNIFLFFEAGDKSLPGSADATPGNILGRLKELKGKVGQGDEFWFFLFGFGNMNRLGMRLAASGARMDSTELADAINAVPGNQFLFFMNQQNYYFMDLLKGREGRTIITAADSEGQMNPPIFTKYLLKVWKNEPELSLEQSISRTGQLVEHYFESNSMAISENSRLCRGGTVLAYPEYVKDSAVPGKGFDSSAYGFGAAPGEESAIQMPMSEKDYKPATEETLKIMADAKMAVVPYPSFSAVYLDCNNELTVADDKSTKAVTEVGIYLIKDVAAEKFARIPISDSPPFEEIVDSQSMIIAPDGSFLEVKPQVVAIPGDILQRQLLFKYPGARAGSLIQLKFTTSRKPVNTIPEVTLQFELQKEIPIVREKFKLQTPLGSEFYDCKVYGLDGKYKVTESETPYSKVKDFSLENVPAFEGLPFDPPRSECYGRLTVTSFKSWLAFYEWTQRILKGCDVLDDDTAKIAKALVKDANTPAGKLKALYEFLCDLRYETKLVGVSALRPRDAGTVCSSRYGDCKEKANALVVMAGAVGIKGYRVLVNRGSVTQPDLPSFQFNHMIAYFPYLEGYPNGLWCDATDGSTSFGTLPPGDIGRMGMVLQDDNFEFKKIELPVSSGNFVQYMLRTIKMKDGTIGGLFSVSCSGIGDYNMRQKLKRGTPLQQQFQIQEIINGIYPGITAAPLEISELQNLSAPLTVKCSVTAEKALVGPPGLALPFDLFSATSMPTRDRPLVLNDGQPMLFRQSVISIRSDEVAPVKWEGTMDGLKIKVTRVKRSFGCSEMVEINLLNGVVPPEKYVEFRNLVNSMREVIGKCDMNNELKGADDER